jgi:hypothetical protein
MCDGPHGPYQNSPTSISILNAHPTSPIHRSSSPQQKANFIIISSSVTSRPVFVSTTSGVAHAAAIAASELITVGRGLLSQMTSSNDTSGKNKYLNFNKLNNNNNNNNKDQFMKQFFLQMNEQMIMKTKNMTKKKKKKVKVKKIMMEKMKQVLNLQSKKRW